MKEISVREARQLIGKLDTLLEIEGEVKITKRGKPIARISSLKKVRIMPSHKNLRESMRVMDRESVELIRNDRDDR
jgi:antitoxin (DNA-binding transcriptional repressor) of toxin-antitoxin stability system